MVVGMLTLGCCLAAGKATAEGHHGPASPGCCDKGYYERVVTCYRPECCEVQVPVVVKKMCYRDVPEQVKTTVMVPREFVEKRTKVNVIQVPVEKVKYVTKYRQVPVKKVDPCTGCCIITHKTECYTEPCRYVVMQPKYETVCYDVKVCRNVPEERIETRMTRVPEWRSETVYQTRLDCKMVPYQKTIRIPCPPADSPAYRIEVPIQPPQPTLPPPVHHHPTHRHG
jgi:hypothetical protein